MNYEGREDLWDGMAYTVPSVGHIVQPLQCSGSMETNKQHQELHEPVLRCNSMTTTMQYDKTLRAQHMRTHDK